jgi:serine/threonine-protein kinase HipA
MATEGTADVVAQIGGADIFAGRLWSHRRGSTESATFAYDPAYLAHPDAYQLDPALALVAGQQQTPAGQKIFGAFSDSAPDRWGRRVIARNAERAAGDGRAGRRSQRPPRRRQGGDRQVSERR